MNRRHTALLSLLLLATPLCADAEERLYLQLPPVLDPTAAMTEAVQRECPVDVMLAEHLRSAIGRVHGSVQSVAKPEEAGGDKLVQVKILTLQGHGGGGWAGPRLMGIQVTLKQGDKTIDSKLLSRATRGAAGSFSSTCSMLERISVALSADTARWVQRSLAPAPARGQSPPTPASNPGAPAPEAIDPLP